MKMGIRTPSPKKSFKARTTGKLKRQVKRSVNPLYGKKGMGWVNDPKKAAYNKVYNKTTIGVKDFQKNIEVGKKVSILEGIGLFFQFIGALFQLIFSLIQLVFYVGIFILVLYIIIKII